MVFLWVFLSRALMCHGWIIESDYQKWFHPKGRMDFIFDTFQLR